MLPQDLSGTEFVNIVREWLFVYLGVCDFWSSFLRIMHMSHSGVELFPHINLFAHIKIATSRFVWDRVREYFAIVVFFQFIEFLSDLLSSFFE